MGFFFGGGGIALNGNNLISTFIDHVRTFTEYLLTLFFREDVIDQLQEQINIYDQDIELLKEQVSILHDNLRTSNCEGF